MDTTKLRQEFAAKVNDAKAIKAAADSEKRDLTEDEAGRISGLLEDAKGIRAKIDAADARSKLFNDLSDAAAFCDAPRPRQVNDALDAAYQARQDGDDSLWERLKGGGGKRLLAFRANPELGISAAQARENAYRAGMWASACLLGSQRAQQWCRDHGMKIQGANFMAGGGGDINAASGGTNFSGEYLVPTEALAAIIDLRETFGVARRLAAIQTMTREVMTINKRVSGLTMYPVGRVLAAAITESNKVWGQIELRANTWAGLSLVSRDLMDDAVINLADDLFSEFAYAGADAEDGAYFNGDGSTTYHGILGIRPKIIDGTHTAGAKDAASGHDTFAELDSDDIDTLMGAAPQYAIDGGNCQFVCSSVAWAKAFQPLLAAGGGNTAEALSGPMRRSYLGYPVTISQKMPTSTADISDTAMILFGDFRRGSVIGDRMGFSAQVLNERYAELRQVGIIGANRWDINIFGLGDNTNAGPIVALIGE